MQPPRATVADVKRDLLEEQQALDRIVSAIGEADWELPTSSPRWAVRDQIGHLAYFDATAALAIVDPEKFAAHRAELFGAASDPDAEPRDLDETLADYRAMRPDRLLEVWRNNRHDLDIAAAGLGESDRVEWYGPSMGSKSFLTARLMEAWAHGQDIADTVGAKREPTDRLLHIAQLGVITRGWSYLVRGEQPPTGDVAVSLRSPSGVDWTWGDGSDDSVRGPAEDFCLVVTQRRHLDDTALEVDGALARDWMSRAQAFAGGPTSGPDPIG